ncbi:hypothetical protein QOZ80_2AG0111230 [Eleusine coracana subsp. coracana]|nr:hypothetical protein QOZ80_2AG0111230 [Eleusine coracana subsp. coracana]
MERAGPWADVPVDLLDRIFARLPSVANRACCSSVSRHWRFSGMQREHAVPVMLPWLLRPSTAGASYFRLFSRTTTNEPAVPENARSARFLGSLPGGWFFVARGQWRGYALLNVVTGDEIRLPEGLQGNRIPSQLRLDIRHSALLILAATKSPALTPDGRYIVAALTLGHHKARIMLEGFEDVIYYTCDEHEGFYFLASQERLLVFDVEFDDGEGVPAYGDFTFYSFPGHQMTTPPEAGQMVAGRYLVESGGRLLMVKRFTSPGRGSVSFQVFRLRWNNSEPYWHRLYALIGRLLFIGRGCSRAFQTGRARPGYIYFLDDAEGFYDLWSIIRTENRYRCSDAGWCAYYTQYVNKSWPQGPPPDCSPWIWLFH